MDSTPNVSRLLVVVLVSAMCGAVVVGVLALQAGTPRPRFVEPTVTSSVRLPSAASQPREVLRRWDLRRAHAWASGDPAALRALYVPGSAAGTHDVAMLRHWVDRSLRVSRLETQMLILTVLREDDRRLELRVTDRVARATASGHGPAITLPVDAPTTRRIVLRRSGAGSWRVAEVVGLGRPASLGR